MRHILVVDDSAAVAAVISLAFRKSGHDVTISRDGREALQAASIDTFDLFIVDEQMPLMTGTEFCRRLRAMAKYQSTPVVFVTAQTIESQLKEDLGISLIFEKPFSPPDLVHLVRQAESCLKEESPAAVETGE